MSLTLISRRKIRASAARLYQAWLSPEQLLLWWGPQGVRCTHAEVDAQVGGQIRIGNLLPDGSTLWILGELLELIPNERVVYTWRTEPTFPGARADERVTVRFEPRGEGETEVIVVHERIADEAMRTGHSQGWTGCLDGLAAYLEGDPRQVSA